MRVTLLIALILLSGCAIGGLYENIIPIRSGVILLHRRYFIGGYSDSLSLVLV